MENRPKKLLDQVRDAKGAHVRDMILPASCAARSTMNPSPRLS